MRAALRRPRRPDLPRKRYTALLDSLTAALQDGVMVEDENGRIVVANAAFCRMFGVGHPSEVVGRLAQDLREELWPKLIDDVDGVRLLTRRLRERREPHLGYEVRLTDGRVMNRDYVPVDAPGG